MGRGLRSVGTSGIPTVDTGRRTWRVSLLRGSGSKHRVATAPMLYIHFIGVGGLANIISMVALVLKSCTHFNAIWCIKDYLQASVVH